MKTIFLTGANGHIGSNIARELLRRGFAVVGYVRETSDLRSLDGLEIELRKGDIMDQDRLTRAAAGCDAVIHTAAVYSTWAPTDADIINPSIVGTDNILQAANAHGIRRIVYTSSAVAVGGSENPNDTRDEGDWNTNASNPYYIAKTDSERLALGLANQLDLELIILNPSIVAGPHDYKPTPSNGIIRNALNGTAPFWDAVSAFVHVDDVARLHVDALTMGDPGERYLVTSVSLHLSELADLMREMFGVRVRVLGMPRPIATAIGSLLGWLSRLTGKPPLFDRSLYEDLMALNGVYDNGKSRRTFGIEYRPIETILADTAAWFAHVGMLEPEVSERVRARYPVDPEWPRPVAA